MFERINMYLATLSMSLNMDDYNDICHAMRCGRKVDAIKILRDVTKTDAVIRLPNPAFGKDYVNNFWEFLVQEGTVEIPSGAKRYLGLREAKDIVDVLQEYQALPFTTH